MLFLLLALVLRLLEFRGMYDGCPGLGDDGIQLVSSHLLALAEAEMSEEANDDLSREEILCVVRHCEGLQKTICQLVQILWCI